MDPTPTIHDTRIPAHLSRRDFLRATAGIVLPVHALGAAAQAARQGICFGVFADPQYAERDPGIGRHYRDSPEKLAGCIRCFNQAKPTFAITLGDLIDNGKTARIDLAALKRINAIYRGFKGPRYYVLGNHDLGRLSKEQFMAVTGMPGAHYAFDCPPFHCIVLDGNYNKDFSGYCAGNFTWTEAYIPPLQQEWLQAVLDHSQYKTIVFVHQPLDDANAAHTLKNAAAIRGILQASRKVVAVFQGHYHLGAYRLIDGIHYFTLRGMIEGGGLQNNAYALVHLSPDGPISIHGFGTQVDYSI